MKFEPYKFLGDRWLLENCVLKDDLQMLLYKSNRFASVDNGVLGVSISTVQRAERISFTIKIMNILIQKGPYLHCALILGYFEVHFVVR